MAKKTNHFMLIGPNFVRYFVQQMFHLLILPVSAVKKHRLVFSLAIQAKRFLS